MKPLLLLLLPLALLGGPVRAAVEAQRMEEKEEAERAVTKQKKKVAQQSNLEIVGADSFADKVLRDHLKEQLTSIEQLGLTAPRADDTAFFLELFYRKHGHSKVNVTYAILPGSKLRLTVQEGPLMTIGEIRFVGNSVIPHEKLFEYVVGPIRERESKAQPTLPFVPGDLEEGVELVRRLYVAEGFLDAMIDAPIFTEKGDGTRVQVTIPIHEGRRYTFGKISFIGPAPVPEEQLLSEILDLVAEPYTAARVADIPRRLQGYLKQRGYYNANVDAAGFPERAPGGRVPVRVTLEPGAVYHFGDVRVTGLKRLRPSYLENRFDELEGDVYDPKEIDQRFRTLMRTGLFNILQINPVPVGDKTLRLDITAEEAKAKEAGVSVGYGTFAGYILGAQYRDRNLFGYGRPVTTSAEISQRGYKGEIIFEDPYLFTTDVKLRLRLGALTYQFEGYEKFEIGVRGELSRKFGKYYEAGLVLQARYVDIINATIESKFLGQRRYQVNSIGFTQSLDFREAPLVAPRGLVVDHTFDVALSAIGSEIDYVRTTARATYYLPFSPPVKNVNLVEDVEKSGFQKWFENSGIAVGARVGMIQPLSNFGANAIPIDERFFNGGSTTVRSFPERELGPRDRKLLPIGGEFYSVFNAEYTFPIYGELHGAVFIDAGNLQPDVTDIGFDDMRYGVGTGLRYQLPIGPIRADYAVNPNPKLGESEGAFHFSFGFAF